MAEAKPAGKGSYVSLAMEELKENKESEKKDDQKEQKEGSQEKTNKSLVEDFLDEFDEEFRRKVREKYSSPDEDISWSNAADEVAVERLIDRFENGGKKLCDDPLLVLLKRWPMSKKCSENPRLIESQVNRLVKIIFNENTAKKYEYSTKKYKYFTDKDEPSWKTSLHLVAELNYSSVAKTILLYFPGQLYIPTNTHPGEPRQRYLPVELSLTRHNDNVSAFLVKQMKPERVIRLFSCDFQDNPVRFQELVEHPNMKKTVIAILNCMVSPDWRHIPKYKEDDSAELKKDIELAWSSEPSDPISYQFYYKILDGDECGRDPTHVGFNWKSKSCLFSIAYSQNKGAIQHPVVRQLVKRKWNRYAHFWFSMMTVLYVVFLLLLSVALLQASTRDDPTQYQCGTDTLRMMCEIVVVILVLIFIADEISEMEKERSRYFKGAQLYYNLFDWFGLLLVLLVIPLRFSRNDAQWAVASLAFIFNVLRLFKYSCVSRTTGLYTKTLARIIYRDVTRFTCVFVVVFLAFCGALFLSLRATSSVQLFGGLNKVLLSGVRALVEQQPVTDDDYTKYKWLPVLVILLYMAAVVIILLNILIAQMSSTYTEAKRTARLQYDVDRMLHITRLEHSRFHKLNLRLKYYKEEDTIDEMKLAQDLLEYSENRTPWESIEERLDDIRNIMRKILKRIPLSNEDKEK